MPRCCFYCYSSSSLLFLTLLPLATLQTIITAEDAPDIFSEEIGDDYSALISASDEEADVEAELEQLVKSYVMPSFFRTPIVLRKVLTADRKVASTIARAKSNSNNKAKTTSKAAVMKNESAGIQNKTNNAHDMEQHKQENDSSDVTDLDIIRYVKGKIGADREDLYRTVARALQSKLKQKGFMCPKFFQLANLCHREPTTFFMWLQDLKKNSFKQQLHEAAEDMIKTMFKQNRTVQSS